jgi:predicted SprT family Zn-dependent metalloprotease
MEQEQIKEQVEKLNKLFNVPPCGVRFMENPQYGTTAAYHPFNQVIIFNARHLNEVTPSIVAHEFAHHLVYQRASAQKQLKRARKLLKQCARRLKTWDFGYAEQQKATLALRCKRLTPKRQRQIHHGDDFVMCLKQIIRKTGMDYSTEREYITVAKKLRSSK